MSSVPSPSLLESTWLLLGNTMNSEVSVTGVKIIDLFVTVLTIVILKRILDALVFRPLGMYDLKPAKEAQCSEETIDTHPTLEEAWNDLDDRERLLSLDESIIDELIKATDGELTEEQIELWVHNKVKSDDVRKNKRNRSKISKPPSDPAPRNNTARSWVLYAVIALVVFTVLMVIRRGGINQLQGSSDPGNTARWEAIRNIFKERKIQEKYNSSVADISLRLLQKSMENSFQLEERNSKNLEPLVLFVISARENKNSSCLLEDIKGILRSLSSFDFRPLEVDGSTITDKEIFDLESQLEEDSMQFAVINSVNKMQPDAFLRLHKYANHQNSARRKLVLALTAYSERVKKFDASSSLKDLEELSSQILEDSYLKHLSRDQFEKMSSRLTSHPVVVLSSGDSKHFICN